MKFLFYDNFKETADTLPDDMRLKFYDGLTDYVFKGIEPEDLVIRALIIAMNPTAEKKESSKKFIKPTISEIDTYCKERNNNISGGDFFDFYESKGWKIGNSPMKDWKSAVRTWEKRHKEEKKVVHDLDWI